MRLLLVEDDPNLSRSLAAQLESERPWNERRPAL